MIYLIQCKYLLQLKKPIKKSFRLFANQQFCSFFLACWCMKIPVRMLLFWNWSLIGTNSSITQSCKVQHAIFTLNLLTKIFLSKMLREPFLHSKGALIAISLNSVGRFYEKLIHPNHVSLCICRFSNFTITLPTCRTDILMASFFPVYIYTDAKITEKPEIPIEVRRDYAVSRKLGNGAQGQVFLCINKVSKHFYVFIFLIQYLQVRF